MKRRYFSRIVVIVLVVLALCIPAFAARIVDNFYFETVAYDWGGGDTAFAIKDNESSAIVNTLSTAGGSVTPWQLFNTRLQMWDQFPAGPGPIVGHKWACSPDARESIPYDYDNMTGWGVRAQFSTRTVGATAVMDGSWSPDSW